MLYTVGERIDLSHLNTNKNSTPEIPMSERLMKLPSKLIPGTRVSFLRMAQGMIVMSVIEPPFMPTVSFG